MANKESVYDEQISPLMEKILHICKAHKISLVCDFGLDEDLHCTSALLEDSYNPSRDQLGALELLRPKRGFALAETITTEPDGSKRISIRRVT